MKLRILSHYISITILTLSVLAGPVWAADKLAFSKGAKAWGDNCSRCHNVRAPQELTDKQWRVVLTHMRIRAGLTGEDTRNILAFLQQSN